MQVFEIALIEPVDVIELIPFLGALDPILTQNLMATSLAYFLLNSTQN